MSNGRLSRRLALAIYCELLVELGAKITKEREEQYADIIEGHLQGKEFKFRVHHKKNGEFSKVDWQKLGRSDLQEIKASFDELINDINVFSHKVDSVLLPLKTGGMSIKEEGACGRH